MKTLFFMDVTGEDEKVYKPWAAPSLRTRRSEPPLPDIRLFVSVTVVELEPATLSPSLGRRFQTTGSEYETLLVAQDGANADPSARERHALGFHQAQKIASGPIDCRYVGQVHRECSSRGIAFRTSPQHLQQRNPGSGQPPMEFERDR